MVSLVPETPRPLFDEGSRRAVPGIGIIAKSGQVEVNSIAPGIAGALLATVAGLAVAIPSLFAYSYISSRMKDAISEMQIFIDEFITRVAEFYSEARRF